MACLLNPRQVSRLLSQRLQAARLPGLQSALTGSGSSSSSSGGEGLTPWGTWRALGLPPQVMAERIRVGMPPGVQAALSSLSAQSNDGMGGAEQQLQGEQRGEQQGAEGAAGGALAAADLDEDELASMLALMMEVPSRWGGVGGGL